MRKAIARVAGPQLLIPCNSYCGDGKEACGGGGGKVGVGTWDATCVGVGAGGCKSCKGRGW